MSKKLPIYRTILSTNDEFIQFWSNIYFYKNDNLYSDNIGISLNKDRIIDLYTWKNGLPLSEEKLQSVNKNFVNRLSYLSNLSDDNGLSDFFNTYPHGGAIWRIFFLHCWKPNKYPIFDQHVYRAMLYLTQGIISEIPTKDSDKISSYINYYLDFYNSFKHNNCRDLDKALWAFGKFISKYKLPSTSILSTTSTK
ncbi:hypothetical protein ACW4YW_13565 [Methylobacillus pratensis]